MLYEKGGRHGAAGASGATPIVLLTKKDLCNNLEEKLREVEEIAIGVDVLAISSIDESYTEVLELLEQGKTYAFLGSSGVGKSTLINRLLGEEILSTNGLRNDDKGRHTNEPGCAILAALAQGTLDEKRWESYRKLIVENAYAADGDSYLREKKE